MTVVDYSRGVNCNFVACACGVSNGDELDEKYQMIE